MFWRQTRNETFCLLYYTRGDVPQTVSVLLRRTFVIILIQIDIQIFFESSTCLNVFRLSRDDGIL